MKTVEQNAADSGIQFLRLMENAGSACARIIKEQISTESCVNKNICVISGNGKNGGDGFVIARKLYEAGYSVNLILACGLPRDEDSIEMFRKLKTLQIKVIRYDYANKNTEELILNSGIIVDAVFGTGFNSCPNDDLSLLFGTINLCEGKVFSIDIPSGIICNTGEIFGDKIEADVTIAISSLKPAHILVPGSIYCGKLIVADIGISESSFAEIGEGVFYSYIESELKEKLPLLNPFSHKGNFGNVLCICGSKNMQGAAVLSAKGATCSGAGLVTVAFPDCAYPAIGAKLTEQLLLPLNSNMQGSFSVSAIPGILKAAEKSDVLLIGCGLGVNSDTKEIIREVIKNVTCPIIIDADGINAIGKDVEIFNEAKNSIVITPHPGEMSRITGLTIPQIQANRLACSRDYSNKFGITIVLKGANTVVAEPNSESIYVNSTGNPGMATGGSGDLLAGIIASFVAQGMKVGEASNAAVYIHGYVGDYTAKRLSMRGLTPTACLEDLPFIMSRFES